MKHLLLTLLVGITSITQVIAQGVALDKTFGIKGAVVTPVKYGSYDYLENVFCQSDGKIITTGWYGSSTPGYRSVMIRYNIDGSFDHSFGVGGIVSMSYSGIGKAQNGMAGIQNQAGTENLILAERQSDRVNWSLLMRRYKPNGSIDSFFGNSGVIEVPNIYPIRLMIDTNKKILVTSSIIGKPNYFGVFRFLQDGQMDSAFGVNGYASRPDSFWGVPEAIKQQKDGKILIGGHTYKWSTRPRSTMGVVRYLPNGDVDSTFGTIGYADVTKDTFTTETRGIIIQSDGKIVIAGISDTGIGMHFFLVRLHQNGKIDSSFGNYGIVRTGFGNSQCWASDIMLQKDDKFYVVGSLTPFNGNLVYGFAIARYQPNGIIDSTFGINGRDTTNLGRRSGGSAGTITPNNSIIVAGYCNGIDSNDHTNDFAVLKYLSGLELGIINNVITKTPVIYPNPISSSMTVTYELSKGNKLTMQLVDINGRIVQSFVKNENKAKGKHTDLLSIENNVQSGQYILKITGEDLLYSIRLQVLR